MVIFDEVYEKLVSGEMSCEEASDIMTSSDSKTSINYLLNKDRVNKLIPYNEEELQAIYMIINIAQYIYNYSGCETGLSDSEYDLLYSIMLESNGSDVVSVSSSTNTEYHLYPALRGTLSKVYYLTLDEERKNPSRRYLDEWKSSMEAKILNVSGKHINLDEEEIYVFPKFDGVSGIFEYDADNNISRVLTRGYTETNEAKNITHHFIDLPKREYQEFRNSPYGLKTEIMMQEYNLDYFNNKYHTDYKNSRSIVSAIINSDEYDEDKASLLHVVPLRVGNADGDQELAKEVFEDYPYLRCKLKDRERIREFALKHKYVHDGLRCDGAVIYIINPEIQRILGRENHKNLYEVAYKFTEESTMSELIDINFELGLFGRLAPVAKVKPVKLKGNTIENISLGSIGRMRNLKLCKGDTVKVLYDIIPYLSFDSDCSHNGGELIEIPERCPECGDTLKPSESMDIVSCVNPNCPCRIKGKILNYLNKMNMDNISYATIDKLFELGFVKSIKDLYKLDKHVKELVEIDGFGEKTVAKWLDSINSSRDVYDYQLLGSLGIEGVSKKIFQKILKVITLDELLDMVDNNDVLGLSGLPNVKDITARKIINGLKENIKLVDFLIDELNVMESSSSVIPRFKVCFTKTREKENYVIEHGGEVSDSLTKDTTFLVVPSLDVSSSKVEKAKKYGIPIVPVSELEETIQKYLEE